MGGVVGVVDGCGDGVGAGLGVGVDGGGDGRLVAIAETPVVRAGINGATELELGGERISGVGGKGPDVDPGLLADEILEEVEVRV